MACGRGTAAVEFAIVVMPFLFLVFGVTEFGRMIWTQSALQYAVEKTARCVSLVSAPCGTPSQSATQMQTYAASQMLAPGVSASAFSYTAASCGNLVSATTTFYFVPGFLPVSATLRAESCRPT
jgi:Flp pilus assembly protein TadG